jgi:uncharacterized BrkB/YihY/UPF0761 family membrane protein
LKVYIIALFLCVIFTSVFGIFSEISLEAGANFNPVELPKKDMSPLYIGVTLSIIGIGAFLYYFLIDKSI